jgi:hypothetical protein
MLNIPPKCQKRTVRLHYIISKKTKILIMMILQVYYLTPLSVSRLYDDRMIDECGAMDGTGTDTE